MNLKDMKVDNVSSNILLIGSIGSGKTRWAATAPQPILLINAEGTEVSYAGKDVDCVSVPNTKQGWNEVVKLASALEDGSYIHEGNDKPRRYKSIIIDNVSAINKMAWLSVFSHNSAGIPTYDKSNTQPLWGQVTNVFITLIEKFKSIPDVNLICTAHLKKTVSESGMVNVEVDIYGQGKNRLMSQFSELYFLSVVVDGKGKDAKRSYLMQTKSDKKFEARSRRDVNGDKLPAFMETVSFEDWEGYFKVEK